MLQFIFKISFLIWLRHVSVSSDHHQGAYDGSLLKLQSLRNHQLKHIVKIVAVQWQYKFQSVHCVCIGCCAACDWVTRRTALNAHTTNWDLHCHCTATILTMCFNWWFQRDCNFSKVPLYAPWWCSEETETCRSHIRKDILNINCSILWFNKKCICWQNSFVLIKMHGKTTIKAVSFLRVFRIKYACLSHVRDFPLAEWKNDLQITIFT